METLVDAILTKNIQNSLKFLYTYVCKKYLPLNLLRSHVWPLVQKVGTIWIRIHLSVC